MQNTTQQLQAIIAALKDAHLTHKRYIQNID